MKPESAEEEDLRGKRGGSRGSSQRRKYCHFGLKPEEKESCFREDKVQDQGDFWEIPMTEFKN